MEKAVLEAPKVKGDLKSIPVEKLYASPRNPRVILDDQAQGELTADVAARGVITALLVRPVKDRYEVLAGSRRLKAAKAAKLTAVPCNVVEVDDDQAHELMVVENLQRKDIHPLDEAINFKMILDRNNGDVLALAKRVNKSEKYIQTRLVLNGISEKFRDWFREGTVTLNGAFVLARLQPADQEAYHKTLSTGEKKNHTIDAGSVQDWTQRHVLRRLNQVPWDVKDPDLDAAAGPCSGCPKRTGVLKDMFEDVSDGDSCTDSSCFNRKLDRHLTLMKSKLGSSGVHYVQIDANQYESSKDKTILGSKDYFDANGKKCDTTVNGLIITGHNTGKVQAVCTNKKCKVHRLHIGRSGEGVSAAVAEKIKDERNERATETLVRNRVLTAVVNAAAKGLSESEQLTVTVATFSRLWHENQKRLLKRRGLIKPPSKVKVEEPIDFGASFRTFVKDFTGHQHAQILLEMALIDEVDPGPMDNAGKDLYAAAKERKVDIKQVKADIAEHERQKKAPKKSNAKK